MTRVLLVSANTASQPYAVYPLGMAIVAAGLTAAGHCVRQFDLLAARGDENALRSAIETFLPEYVGISLRNIDDTDSRNQDAGWFVDQARRCVAQVRESGEARVVLGGPAFSILPEPLLAYTGADFGIVGPGEYAFAELIAAQAEGRTVPRILRGDRRGPAFSPLWEPDLTAFYLEASQLLNLQTKQGCPHRCAYCTYPALEGRRFHLRDPACVVEDVRRAWLDFGCRHVFFTDAVFNDAQGHYLLLAEALARAGLPVRFSAFFRPTGLGQTELELLKRAGLQAMELGTDAASDATLDGLDKGFCFAEALACSQACRAAGIAAAHFVIFGGPGETPATVEEGLGNLERLGEVPVFMFSGIRVLPGTQLHARALAEGVVAADDDLLRPRYYFSPEIEPERLHGRLEESFRGQRMRFYPPAEAQLRLEIMRRFGFRGLLWDRLLETAGRGRRRKG